VSPALFFLRTLLFFFSLLSIISTDALGQDIRTLSRITAPVDESQLTAIRGNVHRMARPIFDHGPAPPGLPMLRMLLVLQRSQEQERALRKLLDDQQDKSSSIYRKWLTPEEFGQRFGVSDQDLQVILSWLQSHGLQVGKVARGRAVMEFSGTAAQVQEAFHTEIHKYMVNGEEHWANSTDPKIPTALAPVVAGVATLHNFRKEPQIRIAADRIPAHMYPGPQPQVTLQSGSHGLGPGDYEVIYNMTSVIQGPPGLSGPPAGFGTTIAVVGRSNVNVQDVVRFRDIFNLPNNTPQVFVDGPDPGDLGGTEEAEAVLDTTWSGALAPGAEVWLVVSASTNTTDGVDLSELYIIDNSAGAIMTESFAGCEAGVTAAEATNISQLAEQAAAEGITYIVAAGDVGSAGCDDPSETQATGPFSVNVLAATPFTVAVGGTEFNENGNNAVYWNSANGQYTITSARSYIPEDVWNESCTVAECGTQKANIASGGGGASTYFNKPAWQSSVSGIPNDGMRDVPDVAMAAAAGHDPYLLCLDGSCQPDAQGNISFFAIGGTSAAAPSFAGMMALVNSAVVPLNSHPRLGQIDYVLYALAAKQNLSSCNGSSGATPPASSCIFNDVTVGSNAVPGEVGYGTSAAKYQSGVGYDLATGLGSINLANLIRSWDTVTFSPTTTTLSLSPTTFTHGTSVTVNIGVTSASGTPTGDVSLFQSGVGGVPSLPVQGNAFTLNGSGSVSASTNLLPGGYYSVAAQYAGDGKFMSSDSTSVSLNVTPEPSSTVAEVLTRDQSGKFIGFTQLPYGSFVYLRADVTGHSGVGYATGSINFSDGAASLAGNPYALNSQGNTATPNGLFSFVLGQHSIVANYGGDPDFGASNSPAVGFTITQASTSTALTSNSATQGVQCSAMVNTDSGGAPPSGTVTFYVGGTQVGSAVPVSGIPAVTNPQTGTLQWAQAAATFTDTALTNGKYTISAAYSGDNNYGASSAPPIVVTVQPDYSLTASSSSIAITSPGGSGSSTLTISAINGFNGAVNFSCSNLPAMSSCQFSPTSVSGGGNTTLSITTTAAVALLIPDNRSNGVDRTTTEGEVTLAGICLVAGMFWRRRWHKLLNVAAFALLLTGAGCGGGGSSGPPPPPPPSPGTTAGIYAVMVTATSGTITHNISLSVNVQ
jgi:hypothetical protein